MDTGGYDADFVDDPSDYLICVICHLALRVPMLFIDCGHRVCQTCFNQMQRHATQTDTKLLCPHDRIELDTSKVVEDKGISRAVLDLKVYCENADKGCAWSGELRDLPKHADVDCEEKDKDVVTRLDLLEQALKRCEERNNVKDKEINELKMKLEKKDDEFTNLKKDMGQRIDALTKQMGELAKKQDETKNKQGSNDSVKGKQSTARASSFDQHVPVDKMMLNVDVYVPDQHSVFIWKLQNYSLSREKGCEVLSPKFYPRPSGPCCMLSVNWYGKNKGKVEVGFLPCEGIFNELRDIDTLFDMEISLESSDETGVALAVNKLDMAGLVDLWASNDSITLTPDVDGRTNITLLRTADFLTMPKLEKCIVDDVLTIKCTITYSTKPVPNANVECAKKHARSRWNKKNTRPMKRFPSNTNIGPGKPQAPPTNKGPGRFQGPPTNGGPGRFQAPNAGPGRFQAPPTNAGPGRFQAPPTNARPGRFQAPPTNVGPGKPQAPPKPKVDPPAPPTTNPNVGLGLLGRIPQLY